MFLSKPKFVVEKFQIHQYSFLLRSLKTCLFEGRLVDFRTIKKQNNHQPLWDLEEEGQKKVSNIAQYGKFFLYIPRIGLNFLYS